MRDIISFEKYPMRDIISLVYLLLEVSYEGYRREVYSRNIIYLYFMGISINCFVVILEFLVADTWSERRSIRGSVNLRFAGESRGIVTE